ncbi:alpha/beta fold hydrolase [Asticcacaulis tiandongensis]|uniref:alpha/beta fold hydrolase n=1 Tax=Asticcacaulis tiandongensis TaxID=2565365 RepID=UPI00112EA418|nr:alpha/beta hydrolase [Asticcacaulis tiandongensis]
MSKPLTYQSADGVLELYAQVSGSENGHPVLCLHGLTRNHRDFGYLAAHLSPDYRVIVPDQRGRGQSAWDNEPARYTLGVYVADMFALLDHLGIEKVTVIGTSMGGLMGMIMASLAPQRIERLVLNDVGPEIAPEGLARIAGYAGKGGPAETWDAAAKASETINAVAFPDYGPDDWAAFAQRTYKAKDGRIVPDYDPAIALGLKPQSNAVAPDLWPLWAGIGHTPVLVIRGALSDLLSAATFDRMLAEHPDSQGVTIANRGHAPMLDEPEVVAAIDRFLKG